MSDVGSDTFAFDVRNRLTSSNGVGSASRGDLTYDPAGRLYEEDPSGSGANRFVYAGDRVIAEENAFSATRRRYVPGQMGIGPRLTGSMKPWCGSSS